MQYTHFTDKMVSFLQLGVIIKFDADITDLNRERKARGRAPFHYTMTATPVSCLTKVVSTKLISVNILTRNGVRVESTRQLTHLKINIYIRLTEFEKMYEYLSDIIYHVTTIILKYKNIGKFSTNLQVHLLGTHQPESMLQSYFSVR